MNGARASLLRLAKRAGVQASYVGQRKRRRAAPTESILAALRALGHPVERPEDADAEGRRLDERDATRLCSPTLVARAGMVRLGAGEAVDAARLRVTIDHEGEEVALTRTRADEFRIPEEVGVGVWKARVVADRSRADATILAPPPRCFREAGRAMGVMLPLHAQRPDPADSLGVATYAHLGRLAEWGGARGARFLGVLPLLATMLDEPADPSPYAPVSRERWSELFIDPRATPEWRSGFAPDEEAVRRLAESDLVDYESCWRTISATLGRLADDAFGNESRRTALRERALRDPDLIAYAAFRAWTRKEGAGWRRWSAPLPERSLDEWLRDADFRMFLYAQAEAERQLAEAQRRANAAGCGLYLDLPVGAAPDGFDCWRRPLDYARGFTVGAPPDAFFEGGQNWGFPAPSPEASRADGHATFRRILDAQLARCSALRIDHVMMMHRLYWIPEGADAKDGLYVRYPAEELYAALAIASHRHEATIVGENLGTVPREVDRALRRWGILGMSVAQFEFRPMRPDPLPRPTRHELACVNTHDTPTFAAFWTGEDIEFHERLGVISADAADDARAERDELRRAVRTTLGLPLETPPEADAHQALDALLERLATSDAGALLVNLEDLWLEPRPQNVPGVPAHRYPSWRRRVARGASDFTGLIEVRERLERLASIRVGLDEVAAS